jgi:uncharacterized protein (TIGR02118 family)
MIKFIALMRRNPTLTHEQFVTYHKKNHAPLFMSLPEVQQHVRRYIQSHTVPGDLEGVPVSPFDGITEIWFDDLDSFRDVFASTSYMSTIRPDEAKFIDLKNSEVMLCTENPVYDL